MRYVKLGNSGLDVSRIGLGCMSYGSPSTGDHSWTLDEESARPFIRQAIEAGINFFDTANAYSGGTSEEILGKALRDFGVRENLVVATKVFGRTRPGPNSLGLSRKAIMTEVDSSLRRLGTDYIDLLQIHRWDTRTPIEETLSALDDVVRSGKVRYLGASSMHAWQFSKALYTARIHGLTQFVSMQNHYNLLYREEEREMLPLCADQGIGVAPWSPLARGRLARAWDETSARAETDEFGKSLYGSHDQPIIDAVGAVAENRGIGRAQVALAWVASRPGVTAPIVGVTKDHHLVDALRALDITLTEAEVSALETHYTPRAIAGFA